MKKYLVLLILLIFATPCFSGDYTQNHGGGATGSASVSDTVYDASSWDNVTDAAPSKNAVRDKIETLPTLSLAVTSHGATESFTAATLYGNLHLVTGNYVVSFPTLVAGMHGRIRATTAAVYSLDLVTGTDLIILNGVALAAGFKATSDGSINNEMIFNCYEAGKIVVNSANGIAIDGGA